METYFLLEKKPTRAKTREEKYIFKKRLSEVQSHSSDRYDISSLYDLHPFHSDKPTMLHSLLFKVVKLLTKFPQDPTRQRSF